jgi:hypothetical protein
MALHTNGPEPANEGDGRMDEQGCGSAGVDLTDHALDGEPWRTDPR